jgi:hypothetical protein
VQYAELYMQGAVLKPSSITRNCKPAIWGETCDTGSLCADGHYTDVFRDGEYHFLGYDAV